jgi:hypothetical protein
MQEESLGFHGVYAGVEPFVPLVLRRKGVSKRGRDP